MRHFLITALFVAFAVLAVGSWQRGRAEEARVEAMVARAEADSLAAELDEHVESLAKMTELARVQDSVFSADTARLRNEVRSAQRRARAASMAWEASLDSLKAHVDSGAVQWVEDLERTHRIEIEAKDAEISALRVENRRLLGLSSVQRAAIAKAEETRTLALEAVIVANREAEMWKRAANPGFAATLFDGARVALPTALLVLGAVAIF